MKPVKFLGFCSLLLAKPRHIVNQFDLNGKTCPALQYLRDCPILCVKSVDDCPAPVRPAACPPGQFYCEDGACHSGATFDFACSKRISICTCRVETKTGHFPCADKMMINSTSPNPQSETINPQCEKALNVVAGQTYLKTCTTEAEARFSITNNEFLWLYLLAGSEFIILLLFLQHKRIQREKLIAKNKMRKYHDHALPYGHIPVLENGELSIKMKFKAYQNDSFGTLTKYSIITFTLGMLAFIMMLIADYYEILSMFTEGNKTMVFNNHEYLSKVFVVIWHILLLWFIALYSKSNSMKTLFMKVTEMSTASYIMVEKNRQTVVDGSDIEGFVRWFLQLESWLVKISKSNVSMDLVSIRKTSGGITYVEFECVRYVYKPEQGIFEPFSYDIGSSNSEVLAQASGITESEARKRIEMNGPNQILFNTISFWERIKQEYISLTRFSGGFYVYQLMTLVIWYFYAYYYMGLVLSSIIIGSGLIKVVVSESAQRKVLQMATFVGYSKVFRNNRWTEVPCQDLVVGDVIEIVRSSDPLSVDCVLVHGEVVVDESSLTGESLPVSKVQLEDGPSKFSKDGNAKNNVLFAGTTVLETHQENPELSRVQAIVLATGGSTEKGKLVRDILYPLPYSFVYNEHLKVVIPLLILWGIFMLFASMILLEISNISGWFYGMFSISQVLSPVLPAVLVIGQSVASERLRSKGIICVDFNRITLAGKVKVFCFDKTGTLTKEGLEFGGVREIANSKVKPIATNFEAYSYPMQVAMQTCHSLSLAQGQVVGNFVDQEMFNATNAKIDSKINSFIHTEKRDTSFTILKRYEFSHTHAYMSSVCRDNANEKVHLFLKGSYEKIMSMSAPSSVPADFEAVAKQLAADGFYVIAIAGKELSPTEIPDKNTVRADLESNVKLIGVMLFRNELKHDTPQALQKLRNGGCRTVMITGDHPNTAIFIARSAGMFRDEIASPTIIIAEYNNDKISWQNIATKEYYQQSQVEKMLYSSRDGVKIELVIAGKSFNVLMDEYWLPQYLQYVRVFARMKPLDKVRCVRMHMAHHITAMCGDGGNDAGALKAAHAGIALSGANSSVVSHFSSTNLSIESCVTLLKEARCSLDVSFSSYKMLIMYGEVIAFIGLVMYYFSVEMSQLMWIFVDGCTVPISWALTMASPAQELSRSRPTARLLGVETISSVVGQIFINVIFMLIAFYALYQQKFFVCSEFDGSFVDLRKWWELADNYEGALIGFILIFQIINAACAFNIGNKYRAGFWKNKVFIVIYSAAALLLTSLMLTDPNPVGCMFHINCGTKEALQSLGYNVWFKLPEKYFNPVGHNVFPPYFRWILFLIAMLNLAAVLVWEGIVITGPVREWAKAKFPGYMQVRKTDLHL